MKKTLVSALTTALVVGAASTALAATNPFADVPADHWAYEAVAQLAQDGVVDGYAADGSFKGNQSMSRYEMAQIVAKAMSKAETADNNDKALVDKLAAEFADELGSLGVRIADLETKVDNVKWEGYLRSEWQHTNFEAGTTHHNGDTNIWRLRLHPIFTVNENWFITGRLQGDAKRDETSAGTMTATKYYAQGKYDKFGIKLGRFSSYSDESHGLVLDSDMDGIELSYKPTSNWKIKTTASRIDAKGRLYSGPGSKGVSIKDNDKDVIAAIAGTEEHAATYWDIEVDYKKGKWDGGFAYRNFLSTYTYQQAVFGATGTATNTKGSIGVFDVGASYKFDNNFRVTADYAWGPSISGGTIEEMGAHKDAYNIQLNYKNADPKVAGSWGMYVAYRTLAPFASINPTYDFKKGFAGYASIQGWEVCAKYTFAKNIIGIFKYYNGHDTMATSTKDGVNGVLARVDINF